MTWLIAILFGLILVALISSSQAAAAGVWKVVQIALIGIVLMVVWGIFIGYEVWSSETYLKSEWEKILLIAYAVLFPPILVLASRKYLVELYGKDKKAAFKLVVIFLAYVIGFMVLAYANYKQRTNSTEELGSGLEFQHKPVKTSAWLAPYALNSPVRFTTSPRVETVTKTSTPRTLAAVTG